MATLQDAIAAVQDVALTLSGIEEAPDYAPEGMMQFPFVVTYARKVDWTPMSDWKKGLHTIYSEIHVARIMLPRAIELAMPYNETFADGILSDPTLAGTVDTVLKLRGTFGALPWADETHIGWRFEIDIKQETAYS